MFEHKMVVNLQEVPKERASDFKKHIKNVWSSLYIDDYGETLFTKDNRPLSIIKSATTLEKWGIPVKIFAENKLIYKTTKL